MPERATSIMPEENVAPSRTPRLATHIVVRKLAIRQPRAELRKLEASLLTPTEEVDDGDDGEKRQHHNIVLLHLSAHQVYEACIVAELGDAFVTDL